MKTTIFTMVLVAVCCFSFTQEIRAEEGTTIYGSSSTEYDEATSSVAVYATTELEYWAQDEYMASVSSSTRDPNTGTYLGSGGTTDYSGAGYAGAIYQFQATYPGQEFQTRSSHLTFFMLQSTADLHIDRWGFFLRYNSEGDLLGYRLVPYFSNGPRYDTSSSMTRLGMSASANIALTMPQDYVPGRDAWNSLTPEEKRFVKNNPRIAGYFWTDKKNAESEQLWRFTPAACPRNPDSDGRACNAYLHAFWNALMTKSGGATLAKEFADAHESYPATGQSEQRFKDMDFHNNAVGRQIATDNPRATMEQLSDLVMQALNQNRLQVLCPSNRSEVPTTCR